MVSRHKNQNQRVKAKVASACAYCDINQQAAFHPRVHTVLRRVSRFGSPPQQEQTFVRFRLRLVDLLIVRFFVLGRAHSATFMDLVSINSTTRNT